MDKYINLVCKVGSTALLDKEKTNLDDWVFENLARHLNPNDILVTSGAVELGIIAVRNNQDDLSRYTNSRLAGIGQHLLMSKYQEKLTGLKRGLLATQILVEHNHFNDKAKSESLKEFFLDGTELKQLSIVNYNDTVDDKEIRKFEIERFKAQNGYAVEGVDNDETAVSIAKLVKAKKLLLLTELDGVFKDIHDKDTLIREISGKTAAETITKIKECKIYCYGASRKGANGAGAKLDHAAQAIKNGMKEVFIASSHSDIADVLAGKAQSTRITVEK